MDQDSKKLVVKRLGAPGTVEIELLPNYTAGDVLRTIGAGSDMILTPAPQLGIVYDASETVWESVVSGQTLFAGLPTPVGD